MKVIKVRLNKIKVDVEKYQPDSEGYIHLPVADDCSVSYLFELFGIPGNDMAGKVVLINSKVNKELETNFNNGDLVEIFKLYAGG